MKRLLTLLLLLSAGMVSGQTVYSLRYDTVKVEKTTGGGNAEFVLKNGTRTVHGYLKNIGNGKSIWNLIPIADVTNLQSSLDSKINSTLIGANNGVAALDAGGKVPFTQLPASLMIYKGTWDASTNTPALSDSVGTNGWVYKATTNGTATFGTGNTVSFYAGDFVIYNGTKWERSVGTDNVVSVNGQQGVVSLNTDHISEGSTNKYYTDTRVESYANPLYLKKADINETLQSVTNRGFTTTNSIQINANTGSQGFFYANNTGGLRWVTRIESAEAGSNTGSDFYIISRDDAGNTLSNPIVIKRSTGNVGIGTINPGVKLDVAGDIMTKTGSIYINTGVGSMGYVLQNASGVMRWIMRTGTTETGSGNVGADLVFASRTDAGAALNNAVLVLQRNTGNVGIGVISPASKLEVAGTGNFTGTVTVATPTASGHAATKGYVDNVAGNTQLKGFHTDASNTDAAETDLYTYTMPGNTLTADGQKLTVVYYAKFGANTNNKQFLAYFDGLTYATQSTTSNGDVIKCEAVIIRTSATTARIVSTIHVSPYAPSMFVTERTGLDFTTSKILKLTGQGTATGDVVAKYGNIEFKPAAP